MQTLCDMTYSFDIFDTCLVRKCGTPENMLDVLSLRVFKELVNERTRQEFICYRRMAEQTLWSNPSATINDIYEAFAMRHPDLFDKESLIQIEIECERELLTPVVEMREHINLLRSQGHHIIYISDMYLPSSLLRQVMQTNGFLKKSDSLYVSCEVGCVKGTGDFYRYVHDVEKLSYKNWCHCGDNKSADYDAPRQLGINAMLINHSYSYYPSFWMENDYSTTFKTKSIVAGIARSIAMSNTNNTHRDFVTDIIAPFYTSMTYHILLDAQNRGIKRLYFCARDAHPIFKIAQQFSELFPFIECKYLFISRVALFDGEENAKLQYFVEQGLASLDNGSAIVDIRSSGRTQSVLNRFLQDHGYSPVYGYYFEMFTTKKIEYFNEYYCEVNGIYQELNPNSYRLLGNWQLYEDYFSMNNFPKTIGYQIMNGTAHPIFTLEDDNENSTNNDAGYWMGVHQDLIQQFVDAYIKCGLARYSDKVLEEIAIPTMMQFFRHPKKEYLKALEEFYAFTYNTNSYVPYVGKLSLMKLILTRGRHNVWRRATIVNSLPEWLSNFLYKYAS